jgi:hypothetical protein
MFAREIDRQPGADFGTSRFQPHVSSDLYEVELTTLRAITRQPKEFTRVDLNQWRLCAL